MNAEQQYDNVVREEVTELLALLRKTPRCEHKHGEYVFFIGTSQHARQLMAPIAAGRFFDSTSPDDKLAAQRGLTFTANDVEILQRIVRLVRVSMLGVRPFPLTQ